MMIKYEEMLIDSETGVEYFLGQYGQMCPRFNRDGSLYCLTREEINEIEKNIRAKQEKKDIFI